MKSTTIKPVSFIIAAVITFGASVLSAQETGRVEIIDIAKVFKENPTLKRGLPSLTRTNQSQFNTFAGAAASQIFRTADRTISYASSAYQKFRYHGHQPWLTPKRPMQIR